MAEILGADIPVPSFVNSIGDALGMTVTIIAFLVLFAIVGAITLYLLVQLKIYNRKIIVFENVSGQGFQPVYRDKARLVKLGDAGEELLYLKKKKVHRTAYGKKMGRNTYWFAIGQDGYWYNIVLGDVDAKMGMLDVEPIDRDMRYMHVAIRKNIQDRYRKQSLMDKYGSFIMNGLFLIIMLAGVWFLLDKVGDISSAISGSIDAAKEVTEATKNIVSSLDNICGGSGIKSAS